VKYIFQEKQSLKQNSERDEKTVRNQAGPTWKTHQVSGHEQRKTWAVFELTARSLDRRHY